MRKTITMVLLITSIFTGSIYATEDDFGKIKTLSFTEDNNIIDQRTEQTVNYGLQGYKNSVNSSINLGKDYYGNTAIFDLLSGEHGIKGVVHTIDKTSNEYIGTSVAANSMWVKKIKSISSSLIGETNTGNKKVLLTYGIQLPFQPSKIYMEGIDVNTQDIDKRISFDGERGAFITEGANPNLTYLGDVGDGRALVILIYESTKNSVEYNLLAVDRTTNNYGILKSGSFGSSKLKSPKVKFIGDVNANSKKIIISYFYSGYLYQLVGIIDTSVWDINLDSSTLLQESAGTGYNLFDLPSSNTNIKKFGISSPSSPIRVYSVEKNSLEPAILTNSLYNIDDFNVPVLLDNQTLLSHVDTLFNQDSSAY